MMCSRESQFPPKLTEVNWRFREAEGGKKWELTRKAEEEASRTVFCLDLGVTSGGGSTAGSYIPDGMRFVQLNFAILLFHHRWGGPLRHAHRGGTTTMMSVWLQVLPNLPSGTAQRRRHDRDTAMIRGKDVRS